MAESEVKPKNYCNCKCKIIIYINIILMSIMNKYAFSIVSPVMPFVVQWEMKSDVETAV